MNVDESAADTAALSRRGLLAAGTLAGAGLLSAAPAAASPTDSVVVDAAGGSDYTSLEQAVSDAHGHTTIWVRRGLYELEGTLRPKEGTRIVGEGYGTHVRAVRSFDNNLFWILNENVSLEHLRIDGNGHQQQFASSNCVTFGARDAPVRSGRVLCCHVEEAAGYNIVVYPGCTNILISGNRSTRAREEGIELQGGSHCVVVGNVVTANEKNGILLWNSIDDCGHNTVHANTVADCGGYGIYMSDGAHDNAITGNTCARNAGWGIIMDAAGTRDLPRNVFSGNVCTENGADGIRLNHVSRCVVTSNVVRRNAQNGVFANNATDCVIRNNVITGNGHSGVRLEGADSVCSGNVCSGNGKDSSDVERRAGITVYGASGNTIVSENRCFDPQTPQTQLHGLAFVTPRATDHASGNLLEGNAASGMAALTGPGPAHGAPFHRVRATVGARPTLVPHDLAYVPRSVVLTMASEGQVWQSADADATHVVLTADGDDRVVEVMLG